jgi:hypothetical protein
MYLTGEVVHEVEVRGVKLNCTLRWHRKVDYSWRKYLLKNNGYEDKIKVDLR